MQQGTNAASTYRYGYDGLGRLTESSRYAGNGTNATNSWCERGIDYDLNGNIVTLQRFADAQLFLAMAKLKHVWFCSSGLRKRFIVS